MGRHEVSVGNLVMGGTSGASGTTLLTTIVSLDPIWLTFNVSEGDGMTYKRLVQKGEIKSARENTVGVQGQLMDEKDWTLGYDRLRRQPIRSLIGHDPRARGVPQSQNVHHARPVRPRARADVAAPPDDPRPRLRGGDRSVGQAPVHRQRRRHGRAEAGRTGAVTDDGLRIIRSGITPDDRVIINGLLRARPGGKVTAEEGTIGAPPAPQGASPS